MEVVLGRAIENLSTWKVDMLQGNETERIICGLDAVCNFLKKLTSYIQVSDKWSEIAHVFLDILSCAVDLNLDSSMSNLLMGCFIKFVLEDVVPNAQDRQQHLKGKPFRENPSSTDSKASLQDERLLDLFRILIKLPNLSLSLQQNRQLMAWCVGHMYHDEAAILSRLSLATK
jgi:hypothetical protein